MILEVMTSKEVDGWDWRQETPTGVLGDTAAASPETGRQVIEHMVNPVRGAALKILAGG